MKPNKTFFIKINHPKMRTETQKNTESQKKRKKKKPQQKECYWRDYNYRS